ncbi:TonB-dependent receptor [Methylophaga sp.]|uniref:TonB-dependent receptor n=1 Tax=Methylophaga sp. TaxID=2024840 RepID=UPI003F69C259
MKTSLLTLSLIIGSAVSASAYAEHVDLPAMSITGIAGESAPYALPETNSMSPDTGELLKKLPGADTNQNGPLTSIAQYRGLFGDRVNVLVDGLNLSTAGPNRMDTPLSYIPSSQLDTISVYRGIAPVSSGIETIGGTIKAESRKAAFTNSDEFELHGNLNGRYATNGDMRSTGLTTSIANQNHRLQFSGSVDRGHDLEFDNGDILPTEHERDTAGIAYGFKHNKTEFDLDLKHLDTGETGTPALPMDIMWIRGETLKTGISHELNNGGKLNARISYQDVEHQMDNFSLRPAGMMQRYNQADVLAKSMQLSYSKAEWQFGVETDTAEHNSDISDPTNPMFFVRNFNDVERTRLSAFAEWNGSLTENWKMLSGVRLSHIKTDADEVDTSMGGMPATFRDQFNAADRSQSDTLTDIAVTFTRYLTDSLDFEFGLARKERAPSYQERYLWLPLEATSGLADGNKYVGNINLNPETAYQYEIGLDWHQPAFAVSPRIFYHHVNDYIQGTAGGPMGALEFNNVAAKLYGFDTNWFWAVTDNWQVDGTVSYVRGKRRDTDDNLYRIAPFKARTQLSYLQKNWRLGIEAVTVAAQNQVSSENDEQKTSGYAYYNLSGQYQINQSLQINAGVNNLFDREYKNHLGGYNRVSDNDDINVGERLPGWGRSFYVGMNLNW